MATKKTFKLINHDRSRKICVACENLKELLDKARKFYNLDCNEELRIVSNFNGEEIFDDNDLLSQSKDTVLMVLRHGQAWPRNMNQTFISGDAPAYDDSLASNSLPSVDSLCQNPLLILKSNKNQLKMLIKQIDSSQQTNIPSPIVKFLKLKCEEELAERYPA